MEEFSLKGKVIIVTGGTGILGDSFIKGIVKAGGSVGILGRNKDKFVNELKESKELIALIKKSTQQDLSKEEKEKVKTQFMDVLKSVPSVGIFLLPGGAILLPLILKIVPDLMPSAFKENEIKKGNDCS